MREVSLTEPLAEKTGPAKLEDIVGQEEGIRSLKAALCRAESTACPDLRAARSRKTAAARLI